MSSHYLRSVDQNSTAPNHAIRQEPRLFQQRLANISHLVSSLTAAVADLEAMQAPTMRDGDTDFDFYNEVERFETGLIRSALRLSNGSQVKAAKLLKLNPTTLNAKMKTLKLTIK
jgi:DNA-binding NtrC family response regulator